MRTRILLLGFVAAVPLHIAQAQQVCEILAKGIQQDVLYQGSDRQRFESARSAICNTTNSSYTSASKSSFDGSLTVPDYVDIAIGTKSDASNWSTNYSQFCSSSFPPCQYDLLHLPPRDQ